MKKIFEPFREAIAGGHSPQPSTNQQHSASSSAPEHLPRILASASTETPQLSQAPPPVQQVSSPIYGPRVVAEPGPNEPPATVDIIAIHGLDGHREESWTTESGTMWLRDLLPGELPTARIITYGYDAATQGSRELSYQSIFGHAQDFLVKISGIRAQDGTEKRPIIFLAHSLGGILLKYALISSSQANPSHLPAHATIKLSTAGVIFIGTPHQGAHNVDLVLTFLHIWSVFKKTNPNILKPLQRDSEQLLTQMALFTPISSSFTIKFVYETQATPIPGGQAYVLVPQSCAVVHGALDAESVGMNRNHLNLVKFDSNTDNDFVTLVGFLKEIAKMSCKKVGIAWNGYEQLHSKESNIPPALESRVDEAANVKLMKQELQPVLQARYHVEGPVPRRTCTPETRTEILSEMLTWAADMNNHRIYCLNGMAGTGKTTIVNTLCYSLKKRGQLGGTFFCSRADTSCSSANRIIPTLAYQLACHLPPLQAQVIEVLKSLNGESFEPAFQHLLLEPLKACSSKLQGPIIIVVDALDECSDSQHVSSLLSNLWTHAANLPIKFLITFRPERIFQSRLHLMDTVSTKLHLHNVEKSFVERDIRRYIKERLAEIAAEQRDRGIILDQSWPSWKDSEALLNQAASLFIYAATVCEYIANGDNAVLRLSKAIAMGHNPTPLQIKPIDKLYTSILQEATNDREEWEKAQFICILSAVTYAQTSLNIQSLASLLSIKVEDIQTSLTNLHSVLRVPSLDSSAVVSTLHASFPDYLGDKNRSHGFFCDPKHANTMLSTCCLVLMDTLQENICRLHGFPEIRAISNTLIQECIPDTLNYACRHWVVHCYLSDCGKDLAKKLIHFFNTHVLHWIECLSLIGALHPSIPALQQLEMSPVASQYEANLQSTIHDTRRFVAQNIELLKTNPLETYQSALIWLPTESQIQCRFTPGRQLPIIYGLPKYWDSCELILTGHLGPITSVALSFDGMHIVSGSNDRTVRVWSFSTGELEHELTGHSKSISSVLFSHDGAHIISGSHDSTMRVWNSATGELVHELTGHSDWIQSVALSYDGTYIVSGSDDETARVWNMATGELVHKLTGHSKCIRSVALSYDGRHIVSGSDDKTVRVWSLATGQLVYNLTGHSDSIRSVAVSHDGVHIVSGSNDHSVRVWMSATGDLLHNLTGHSNWISSVAFSHNGTHIVSSSRDGTVQVWNTASGKLEHKLTGHTNSVLLVAFSYDGIHIISGSDDYTICIWNSATGKLVQKLIGHSDAIQSVASSQNGTCIISGSNDNTIRVWNTASGELEHKITGRSASINLIIFSYDGSYILSICGNHTFHVWNSATRELVYKFTGHSNRSKVAAVSDDGTCIATSHNNTLQIWNSVKGQLVHTLTSYFSVPRIGSNSFRQELLHPQTGRANSIQSVTISHNGAYIVSSSYDHTLQVWNSATGELVHKLTGHRDFIRSVTFSHDETYIVSGSYDGTIQVWNSATGKLVHNLTSRFGQIWSVAVTHDETGFVSSSGDRTGRVWDMVTKESKVLSEQVILPDQTTVSHRPGGQFVITHPDTPTTKKPLFITKNRKWLIVSPTCKYWIPPQYSNFTSFASRHNMAALGYSTGNLLRFTLPTN